MTNFVFLLVLRNGNLAEKELIFKENNNESVRKKTFATNETMLMMMTM